MDGNPAGQKYGGAEDGRTSMTAGRKDGGTAMTAGLREGRPAGGGKQET
jgi:hypothetical protein